MPCADSASTGGRSGGVAERVAGLGDRSSWRALAELGVFGILVPADAGGSGLGCVEATVVLEQLGAHLVEGPGLYGPPSRHLS